MVANIKSVLSVFNSEAGAEVRHDAGAAMVTFADSKSAYGRAVRDITAVALSGRWRDENGEIMSDNAIGHAMGVAMRQPRARLNALVASGLVFESDADIKANVEVWAHVAKMYNAGKAGRARLKEAVEIVKAITDVADKRAAWLDVEIPARDTSKREARPNDGTSNTDTHALSGTDADERFPISEAETSTLLSYLANIGTELTNRFPDMSAGERIAFRENVALLAQTLDYASKQTAKK
jgi:hypothetical protein